MFADYTLLGIARSKEDDDFKERILSAQSPLAKQLMRQLRRLGIQPELLSVLPVVAFAYVFSEPRLASTCGRTNTRGRWSSSVFDSNEHMVCIDLSCAILHLLTTQVLQCGPCTKNHHELLLLIQWLLDAPSLLLLEQSRRKNQIPYEPCRV